jgi:PAS domain S-box-containing protein
MCLRFAVGNWCFDETGFEVSPVGSQQKKIMPFSSLDSLDPCGCNPGTPGNSAALLAGVLNTAMDAIIVVDQQQRIVLYNHAAEEIFGWPRQEVMRQPIERLIPERFRKMHPQQAERYGSTGATCRRMGMGMHNIVYGLRSNGEEFPLDASISLLDTPEGKLFTVIMRDITELDRLQKEQLKNDAQLRESQRRLLVAQQLARIAYWQLDLNTNLMWWCGEAGSVLGVDRTPLDGTYDGFLQLIHPGDRSAFETKHNAAAQAGVPLEAEFRVITSSNEVRWIHLLGRAEDNGEGEMAHRRTGVVREITKRKRSERVIARSVDLLNRTGALARVGGWELVTETMKPHYSEEIFRIHGLEPSMIGALKDPISFYPPEAQPVIRAAVKAALENATPWDLELPLVTAKGQCIWVRTQGRAMLHDGKVVRLFGVLQDITEIKATEAALRLSNQELEAFSYSVSHDLRSPLNTINGFSHLLAKKMAGSADKEVRHYLSRIQAGAAQMGQLIDGLLALAQVSRVLLQSGPVDLSAMARSILDEWRERDPERQVTIHIGSGLQAQGDTRLVRMVLENLLGNAWKFSSKKPQAEISIGQHSDAEEWPVFFVRDNGAGFDMAYADKLFSPFQRLHATSEFPGTGIGLATVSRVIKRHGGRLWTESATGRGASFFFTLPGQSASDASEPRDTAA